LDHGKQLTPKNDDEKHSRAISHHISPYTPKAHVAVPESTQRETKYMGGAGFEKHLMGSYR